MKNLLVLRHASAASTGPDGTDRTRGLTAAGEQEAMIQGGFLREAGIVPDHVACSAALRARRTAEILTEAMAGGPAPEISEALYNTSGEEMLEFVQALADEHNTVLLVGHMPGVAELLDLLTEEFAEVTVAYSPCTLTGVSFGELQTWSHAVVRSGTLEWLLPPLLLKSA